MIPVNLSPAAGSPADPQASTSAPSHAFHGLKFRASVDWIEIRVRLASPSQPHPVRKRMPLSWGAPQVTAMTEEPSGTAIEFQFRVQDPLGPRQLMREIQSHVRSGHPPITEGDVTIVGLEVAIDAKHPTSDSQALALAALHFLRHHAHPPEGIPRITIPFYFGAEARLAAAALRGEQLPRMKGRYRATGSPREGLQALQQGLTINAGCQNADYCARYYVKRHDTRDGVAYAPLAPSDHRARFEVTLKGNELPFHTIDGWRSFRFETMAERFAMVRVNHTGGVQQRMLEDRVVQFGRPDDPRKRASHRRISSLVARRDTTANEAIRVALRGLTRRQKCGNSDEKFDTENLPSIGGSPATRGQS